jgi:hypothetical protein
MAWFVKNNQEDPLITAYKDQIAYLKATIERLTQEREAERVEYKRAMDVLLVKEQLPIVGQHNPLESQRMDVNKMLAYMDSEVPETK